MCKHCVIAAHPFNYIHRSKYPVQSFILVFILTGGEEEPTNSTNVPSPSCYMKFVHASPFCYMKIVMGLSVLFGDAGQTVCITNLTRVITIKCSFSFSLSPLIFCQKVDSFTLFRNTVPL